MDKEAHEVLYDEFKNLKMLRDELRDIFEAKEKIKYLPVNIGRLITQAQFNIPSSGKSDLNPIWVYKKVQELAKDLKVITELENDVVA